MKKQIPSIKPLTISIVLCLLFFCSNTVLGQAVQSDYQIQNSFRQEVQQINQAIAEATAPTAVDSLAIRVDSLEKKFADHRALINKVIYPETFDDQISELEKRAQNTHQYLVTIRQQEQQLQKMNDQLSTYSSRLNNLTSRTDSLKTAVQQTERSQSQLAAEVEEYKNQLRQRDELILSFIDSVVVNYQNMGVNSLNELKEAAPDKRLNVGGNPLELMRSISQESIELLESNTVFSPEDYLRMKAVNKEFGRMWSIVGEDLSRLYSEEPAQTQEEITQEIQQWEKTLDGKLWASLQKSVEESGIELAEFHSDTAFYNALNSYVNRSAAQSRENNGEESYQKFNRFTNFWNNTVKQQWTDHLTRAEMMSSAQVAQIDQKVNQWASFAEQESHLLAYLLGGSLLIIALLGFMLFHEKRNGADKSSDPSPA